MVSALASQAKCFASQAKGKGSFPSCGISFFSHKYFSFFPFQHQTDNPSIRSDFISDCHTLIKREGWVYNTYYAYSHLFNECARRFSEVGAVQFRRRVVIGILLGWLGV